MNNDVKAAVEKLREAFEFDCKRCGNDTAESLWRDELLILAHIDGEPARIAAACEEQREACAQYSRDAAIKAGRLVIFTDDVRATPLTATPLEKAQHVDQPCGHPAAVANKSVETGVAFCDLCRLNEMLNDALAMEAKHKAERDAKHQLAAAEATARARAEAERDEAMKDGRTVVEAADQMRQEWAEIEERLTAERDALRAQVEAARTYARQALDYGEDCDATDLLAAMDGAKP